MAKKNTNTELVEAINEPVKVAYELALLMPPVLPDDIQKRILPKVNKLVSKHKGNLTVTDDWGKRHLAYEVKGNEEGYYLFAKLEILAELLEEFQSELSRINDVLRFLLIKEEIKKPKTTKNLPKEVRDACPFNGNPDLVDYKDVYRLRKKFITTRGRILPASKTGVSHRCQRKLGQAIKRARYLALLPYVNYT